MKIGIDIGHNCPPDTGAMGVLSEDKLNQEVGEKVIQLLQGWGHQIVDCKPKSASSVRDSLYKRVTTANNSKVEIFCSIHFNAANANASGTETLIYQAGGSAEAIARRVQTNLVKTLGLPDRKVKAKNLYVVRYTKMPAILVEVAFCDSRKDMDRIRQPGIIDKVAEAIAAGLVNKDITILRIERKPVVNPQSSLPPTIQAFLDVIAYAEGTDRPDKQVAERGYRMLFGGESFYGYQDHPRTTKKSPWSERSSDAAGRYQVKANTFDWVKEKANIPDFSPTSQDKIAVWLIESRGAMPLVMAGKFKEAIAYRNDKGQGLGHEWASLPGSPYGQPIADIDELERFYRDKLRSYQGAHSVAPQFKSGKLRVTTPTIIKPNTEQTASYSPEVKDKLPRVGIKDLLILEPKFFSRKGSHWHLIFDPPFYGMSEGYIFANYAEEIKEETTTLINLADVAKFYQGLPHQQQAIAFLQERIDTEHLVEFARLWRRTPEAKPRTLPEKIVAFMKHKGFEVSEGEGEFNLIGIEGFHPTRNVPIPNTVDQFNDCFKLIQFSGGKPKEICSYEGTVNPGLYWLQNPQNSGGCAQYEITQLKSSFQRGSYKGAPALLQARPNPFVRILKGKKFTYDPDNRGMHFHRMGTGSRIGKWSAGCIGCQDKNHYDIIQRLEQDPRFRIDKSFFFTITLLSGEELFNFMRQL